MRYVGRMQRVVFFLVVFGVMVAGAVGASDAPEESAPRFSAELRQALRSAGNPILALAGELPAALSDAEMRLYEVQGVTQSEAELLFAYAHAAVFYPETGIVRLLSDTDASTWSARPFVTPQEAGSAEVLSAQSASQAASSKARPLGQQSLMTFASSVDSELRSVSSQAREPQYVFKFPSVSTERSTSQPRPLAARAMGTNATTFTQDFEGDVWSDWDREDNSGGLYRWGQTNCDSHSGQYSADAIRGGSQGTFLGCTAAYPASLVSEMEYQVCEYSQPDLAWLDFYLWQALASDSTDKLGVYLGDTYRGFWGYVWYGNVGSGSTWWRAIYNLKQWYYLGDVTREYCNTILFSFSTDATNSVGFGSRVDDVTATFGAGAYVPGQCAIVASALTGTAPLAVNFQAFGDAATSYYWNFDDGSTSDVRNPSHTFTTAGEYDVTLRTSTSSASCRASLLISVSPGSCTYSIAPPSQSFSASGGTGTVNVTASGSSCTWGATSNAAWITVTSGAAGSGSGSVGYTVSANTGSARTGTLTIANQTFTVNQEAASTCVAPSITTHPASVTIGSGLSTILSVWAAGTAPLNYQWFRGFSGDTSNPISGATGSSYTTPALTSTTSYWVRVTNACGTVYSNTATVTVSGGGGSYAFVVPGIAHWPGANNTAWRSDLSLVNRSGSTGSVTVSYASVVDGMAASQNFNVQSGVELAWRDILVGLFGLAGTGQNKGVVRVASNVPLAIVARTYNETPDGTYGQALPAVDPDRTITTGQVAILPNLANNALFRTNIGVTNIGAESCSVRIQFYSQSGAPLGSPLTITAGPASYAQKDNALTAAGAGTQDQAYATAEVTTTGCKAWMFGSVVDNASGDPTTIEMIVP